MVDKLWEFRISNTIITFLLVQVFQRLLSMSTQKGSFDHKFHICWQNTLVKNICLDFKKNPDIYHSSIKAVQVVKNKLINISRI